MARWSIWAVHLNLHLTNSVLCRNCEGFFLDSYIDESSEASIKLDFSVFQIISIWVLWKHLEQDFTVYT